MRVEYLVPMIISTTGFQAGVNLFVNYMPDTIKTGVLILPSLMGGIIDPYVPEVRAADKFQIVSRSADMALSRQNAQTVSDCLRIKTDTTFEPTLLESGAGSIKVMSCRPANEPIVYPRPISGSWETSVNFVVNWMSL